MSGAGGFWIARRMRANRIDRPFERKRPKMPSGPWRVAAAICFAAGALASWLLFRDTSVVVLRVIIGGLVTFAVGMYVVESFWERWYRTRADAPASPIGKRR